MGKKEITPRYCPAWFVQAAEVMVRQSYNLKQAALEIGHPLDPDEADAVSRRRDFQEIVRVERNKYYAAVANDPSRTKSTVLGRMHVLADKLIAEGELDKAALVLEKLAKMEGWSGNEGNINIFSGLTARDIAEAKERLVVQTSGGGGSKGVGERRTLNGAETPELPRSKTPRSVSNLPSDGLVN